MLEYIINSMVEDFIIKSRSNSQTNKQISILERKVID